jgi:DUF1680 family protein
MAQPTCALKASFSGKYFPDGEILYRRVHSDLPLANSGQLELISIPYYAWANRIPGTMRIWPLHKNTRKQVMN